jgi:hypothetical protein
MSRIFWTDEERNQIHQRMVEIYSEGRYRDRSIILLKAQQVLPINRRRKLYPSMLYKLSGWIESAKIDAYTQARDKKLTEVALETAAPAPTPAPVEPSLGELFEHLVNEVTRRITAEVRQALAEEQPGAVPVQTPAPPVVTTGYIQPVESADKPPKRERKTSVLIIGLNGQQITVTKQNNDDLEIICMTPEEALCRSPIRAEYTVLMTKFINHSVQGKYRHAPNLRFCNGGITDLSIVLKGIRLSNISLGDSK